MKFKLTLKPVLLLCIFIFIIYILTRKTVSNKTYNFRGESTDNYIWQNKSKEPDSSKYSMVILVQVHDRIKYLRELINSLSKVSDISSTLLIFSHDLIDEEINSLIRNITFCEVLQIYFPYSIQNFPDKFPGDDPNDCPRDIPQSDAIKKNCNSSQFPDKHKHYREPKICQIKHHWWWKANHAIDSLEVTRNHTGLFLLLEEDLYVLPDLVHVAKKMDTECRKHKDCAGLVMGDKDRATCPPNVLRVGLQKKMGSIGLAIYRKTWELLKKCSKEFCTFDDYNWDFSILRVMKTCLNDQVSLMFTDCSPRVLHLGVCGVHIKSRNCDAAFKSLLKSYKAKVNNLNPDKISVVQRPGRVMGHRPNGGWADPRDHKLCMSMVNKDMG